MNKPFTYWDTAVLNGNSVTLFGLADSKCESPQVREDLLLTEISAHTTSDDKSILFYYILDLIVDGEIVLREPLSEIFTAKSINIPISKGSNYKISLNYLSNSSFTHKLDGDDVVRVCLRGTEGASPRKIETIL